MILNDYFWPSDHPHGASPSCQLEDQSPACLTQGVPVSVSVVDDII